MLAAEVAESESEGLKLRIILIICPKCQAKKALSLPAKVINESKQLTTISIPSGLVCEHSFQAFVDKNFKVRGYQNVDFEFRKMEFYESADETGDILDEEEGTGNLTTTPIFQGLIQVLREFVDDNNVLGGGIFTIEGKMLYSSLPQTQLFNIIKEFEVRSEKNLEKVKRILLEFENEEKICSEYKEIHDLRFILVVMFSSKVKFGMANLYLRELTNNLKEVEKK